MTERRSQPAAITDLERVRRSIEAIPDVDAVPGQFAPDARSDSLDLGPPEIGSTEPIPA